MNFRDLINKLDAVDSIIENNQKAFRQDPEGAIARAQAGANGMGLLGAMGGYALANMGNRNQNSGNMQPGGQGNTVTPMQPGTTTTTTGPAVPVGQPYLDTAHTINYNKPNGNIAGAPSDTTNKSPRGNDALEDADIKKLNALVDQLEKTLKEGVSFDFAKSLVESFGYQLDETTNINPDAAGFLQTKLNVAAPQSATFDPNQKYRDTLARQDADKAANAYSDSEASELRKQAAAKAAPATAVGKEAEIAAGLQKAGVPVAKNAEQAAAQVASKVGAKTGLKAFSKYIPGVGLVVGTLDAINRAKEGDWTGAGIAGLSAVLSLAGPIGSTAALGLDAINIGRDIKHGEFDELGRKIKGAVTGDKTDVGQTGAASPAGTTGGDPKLVQLQKIIGAKPDGFFGPETKGKLQTWQQSKGITADGQPGPETYGAAGLAETRRTTVAEDIQNTQRRLALIESKSIIRKSLDQRYYLDEQFFICDQAGNIITDLTTISVINEAAINGDIEVDEGWGDYLKGAAKYGGDAINFGKSLFKGGANPTAAAKLIARDGKKLAGKGLSKSGLKAGAAIANNPKKAIAAAAALGGGVGYGLADKPTSDIAIDPNIAPLPVGPHDVTPVDTPVDTPVAPVPVVTTPTELTADQKALIAQIREIMGHDYGEDQKWDAAVSHAQEVLDRAEGANALQLATDRGHASGAASALAMNDNKPKPNNIAAMPSMPKPGQPGNPISGAPPGLSVVGAIPGTPGATPVVSNAAKMLNFNPYQGADAAKFASFTPAQQAWLTKGGGVPDISGDEKNNPILYRMKSANPDTNNPTKTTSNWEESINESDKELARWLKIAQG